MITMEVECRTSKTACELSVTAPLRTERTLSPFRGDVLKGEWREASVVVEWSGMLVYNTCLFEWITVDYFERR
jgi:hypothetical protein